MYFNPLNFEVIGVTILHIDLYFSNFNDLNIVIIGTHINSSFYEWRKITSISFSPIYDIIIINRIIYIKSGENCGVKKE